LQEQGLVLVQAIILAASLPVRRGVMAGPGTYFY